MNLRAVSPQSLSEGQLKDIVELVLDELSYAISTNAIKRLAGHG